jgi:hypothetical protein
MPVIMKENVQYAYTDKGIKAHTLSYAEYQALSTEGKMNGDLYFIPDKQPEGNPSLIWDKLGTATLDTDADNVSDAVNELNSKFEKISEQGQIAISNITSAERLSYRKVGNVVILDLTFTVGTAIPSSSSTVTLLKGFPPSFSGRWRFRLFHMTENKIPIQCCVTPDGTIENAYSTGGISTGTWTGQVTYICQDN